MNRTGRNLCPPELTARWGRWTLHKIDEGKAMFCVTETKQGKEIGESRAGERVAILKQLVSKVLARKLILEQRL